MANTAFTVIVILLALGCSLACRCLPRSDEDIFCTSDYAAAIYVKGNGTVIGFERVYKIQTLRMFGSTNAGRVRMNRLYSGTHSCGVRLRPDTYYVISGTFETNADNNTVKMTTMLCQLQKQLDYRFMAIYTWQRNKLTCH